MAGQLLPLQKHVLDVDVEFVQRGTSEEGGFDKELHAELPDAYHHAGVQGEEAQVAGGLVVERKRGDESFLPPIPQVELEVVHPARGQKKLAIRREGQTQVLHGVAYFQDGALL